MEKNIDFNKFKHLGQEMHDLMVKLFPITRSLTGNGVRETLGILNSHIPINCVEVKTGTKAFDWVVPKEWNIKDAYIKDSKGKRIVDYNKSNLHVVGYSTPIKIIIKINALLKKIHTLKDQPSVIPYTTSYYKEDWGFCIAHNDLKLFKDDQYEVCIDSTLKSGSLTYGEIYIKGRSNKEILLSCNICHPSMANNELSGPILVTFLAKYLLKINKNLKYSYRILYLPETIGSIVYLSKHYKEMKKNVIGGYTVTCAGDPGEFSYLMTPYENSLVDRITLHVLKHSGFPYKIYNYLDRGSDEMQYGSPNIGLRIGSLMRSKYREYPEYHTSADNLDFVKPESMADSLGMYLRCLSVFENNEKYKYLIYCEPQLGRRGLYHNLSTVENVKSNFTILDLIAYTDGDNDLLSIAESINKPIFDLYNLAKELEQQEIFLKL
jgi:aminopeptidase-like protein